ncbi:MAG: 1-(5-phosphoribosyl)-5-[(5-phosphoribosylamino)methylideneamino]imidazole-4-carboxamide isomerase [Ruminococcaceae bacterium]|nr:1-(5-phosphoribosyl)-5-[(5-phosphoribosylamino)methylideneamino]imidazole-4-carboxamide isomerase [Oscillospiraceae bacterium]
MYLFPAIDLYEGKAVRLYKGDYNQLTVYNDDPAAVAKDFAAAGAKHIHIVDLEGAKSGTTPNLDTVIRIKHQSGLFCEIGGGVRNMAVVKAYMDAGIDRVILGTAAVEDPEFVREAVAAYGDKIAVGVDLKDGYVAVKGWTEQSTKDATSFCREMQTIGVRTVIVTDISKDGAMQGTNHALYRDLQAKFPSLQIVASGGVSSMQDVEKLAATGLYGAIIGKAYYVGAINLKEAQGRVTNPNPPQSG